jgi:hypothetical protein
VTRWQAGLAVAVLHVALLGSLGLKLRVDRSRFPHAWARTAPFDPSTPLRGRYVRLAVEIPLAGAPLVPPYTEPGVELRAVKDRVLGEIDSTRRIPRVRVRSGDATSTALLADPVAFFIPEHVPDPSIRPRSEELWVELTLPPGKWPRPIRLGVMRSGKLTPLELR